MYDTLVRPTLEYSSMVWDPYTHTNIGRLEQNNTMEAGRFITDNYTNTPGIRTRIKQQVNMEPLHIHRLALMYRITYTHIDSDSHTYLHNTNNEHTYNTYNHKCHTNTAA